MRAAAVGLDEQELSETVASSWDLPVDWLHYVPEGGGSYHWLAGTAEGPRYFLTVDDLHCKPWLGADPEPAFAGLQAAFDTALALCVRAGLQFVVPPVPALSGETAYRLTPRYSVAVFPFIEGSPGRWGDEVSPEHRERLVRLLAELHLSTPVLAAQAPRRGLGLHERAGLEAALAELSRPWTGGPFSEPARHLLAANADTVLGWLASFDDLAAHVRQRNAEQVVTHGEPHPGNFIHAASGLALIDWDTVALAPPERDLWMLDDGSAGSLASYSQATGRAVDDATMAFYRLTWTLADLAAFTGLLRSGHRRDPDTRKAWEALTTYLRPEPPEPYSRAISQQNDPSHRSSRTCT